MTVTKYMLMVTAGVIIIYGDANVVESRNAQLEYFVSSCETDTNWRRGGPQIGLLIKSWIQSIVVTTESGVHETKVLFDEGRAMVMEVGNYSSGELEGLAWRRYCHECEDKEIVHDGWLYGRADKGEMSGPKIVYLYPDLYTVLIGQFHRRRMVRAIEGRVTAYRCRNNMLEIKYATVKARKLINFFYNPINSKSIHKMPTVMDPYERRVVRIDDSKIAENKGDGVFAKRDLKAGEIVLFYSGIHNIFEPEQLYLDNMTTSEREDIHKNMLSFDSNVEIDVPPYYSNILRYRASLGHKINHSFNASTHFCHTEHPRLGSIKGIKTLRKVGKGEELSINYEYNEDDMPGWYKLLHQEEYGDFESKKDGSIDG